MGPVVQGRVRRARARVSSVAKQSPRRSVRAQDEDGRAAVVEVQGAELGAVAVGDEVADVVWGKARGPGVGGKGGRLAVTVRSWQN